LSIHSTAIVSPRAEIGRNVRIGPYSVIAEDVQIGDDTEIGAHVVIDRWTTIGKENQIFAGAVIGTQSQDLKYKGERSFCIIGDGNVIREYVTINRATIPGARTLIGDRNAILAYCHVAHDCQLGNFITISNVSTLAGHVRIDDRAGLGGYVGVHQYCHIGAMAYVGGWSKVVKDVPPYVRVSGAPLKVYGLNSVGLERSDVPPASRKALRRAYYLLYRSNNNVSQALDLILADVDACEERDVLVEFLRGASRGIVKNLHESVANTDPLNEAEIDDGPGEDGSED
jgi:UDP-N-acetylglucosamine acyltransferase